jgi:hypothetical protein
LFIGGALAIGLVACTNPAASAPAAENDALVGTWAPYEYASWDAYGMGRSPYTLTPMKIIIKADHSYAVDSTSSWFAETGTWTPNRESGSYTFACSAFPATPSPASLRGDVLTVSISHRHPSLGLTFYLKKH